MKRQTQKNKFSKQNGKIRSFLFTLLIMLLFLSPGAIAQTKKVFFIGNSVTDAINLIGLESLSTSGGKTLTWSRHMIPGAPLDWIWDHPDSGFEKEEYGYYPNALTKYTWDAISFQPFDRDLADDSIAIKNFVQLAKTKSPSVQIYIYQRWPRCPNSSDSPGNFTADQWSLEFDRPYPNSSGGNVEEGREFFQKLTMATRNANMGIVKPLMVPVGEVMYRLNAQMKAGSIPGYSSAWSLYSDGIHFKTSGNYVASCTYYATIFKADPRGLGVPSEFGTGLSAAFVAAVQNTVWDVLNTYKDASGNGWAGLDVSIVNVSDITLTPNTLTIAKGATSQLTATVAPANANNKTVIWTSSKPLVAEVSSTGFVTTTGAGTATITATTSDGGFAKTCALTVTAPTGNDTQAPTAPTALVASNVEATTFTLSWSAATDNFGISGYDVYNGANKLNTANITTTTYVVSDLTSCTTYPTFTVRAKDTAGNSTSSSALSVKTNCQPTAVLNASTLTVEAGAPVTFDCVGSTDPDAGDYILGFTWDFGDGSPVSKANGGNHAYATPGSYTVSLMVMDNRNLYSAPVTKSIQVTPSTTGVNLALLGEGNCWSGNATAFLNANKKAEAKVNDDDITSEFWLRDGDDGAGAFQAAGVVWAQAQSAIAKVEYLSGTFENLDWDNGGFSSDFSLQTSTDGTTWLAASGWTLSPAYEYGTLKVSNAKFVFTSISPVSGLKGVRVSGKVNAPGSNSWNASAKEIRVLAPSTSTAVKAEMQNDVMIVYPNPAYDQIFLNFGSKINNGIINIVDLQGRTLLSKSVSDIQIQTLEISSLKSGIYFLKVVADGNRKVLKFTKK